MGCRYGAFDVKSGEPEQRLTAGVAPDSCAGIIRFGCTARTPKKRYLRI